MKYFKVFTLVMILYKHLVDITNHKKIVLVAATFFFKKTNPLLRHPLQLIIKYVIT